MHVSFSRGPHILFDVATAHLLESQLNANMDFRYIARAKPDRLYGSFRIDIYDLEEHNLLGHVTAIM